MADTVDTAMEQLNTALKMSEIDGTAEIAGVQEVDYAESGNISIDLHNLKSDFDDHLDEAHALRAEYQADLVSLWVDYKEYAGETSIKSSFSTVSTRYAVSNLSFAHEIGHTLGCYHDRYNMTYLPHASAYGYRFHGKSGGHYRTLMAYHPGERIPRFSNPAVLFDGVPTGIIEPEPDAADCAARVRASWDQMSSRFEDYVQ